MERTYWHRQSASKPLFEQLLWSRPQNMLTAGKLLIIGGSAHGFAAPATAFQAASVSGAGSVKVLLPDVLKKALGGQFEAGEYAPSTPSGSFARQALAEMIGFAGWADGVLLAGDLGHNSETAVVLEQFVQRYTGQLTLAKDSTDYFYNQPRILAERPETTVVISLAQLQKLLKALSYPQPITFGMELLQLVETLHRFTSEHRLQIIVRHKGYTVVGSGGKVSTTPSGDENAPWRVNTAAAVAVWWLQNPSKPFQALTTALLNPPTMA